MSYWDLRQWIESSVPWWAPLAVAPIAYGIFYLIGRYGRRR